MTVAPLSLFEVGFAGIILISSPLAFKMIAFGDIPESFFEKEDTILGRVKAVCIYKIEKKLIKDESLVFE